jgi:hypothetical protein
VEPGGKDTSTHILDFNGNLHTARATANGLDFSYQNNARAIAVLDFQPNRIEIDGVETKFTDKVLMLPRGQHLVVLEATR